MFQLVNVMEILVGQVIEEVIKSDKTICNCRRCRLDMSAIALNNLPTKYVVTVQGEVLHRTSVLRNQCKVDIIRALTEAIKIVRKNPHHSRED